MRCWSCLEPDPDAGDHHRRCAKRVFGTPAAPSIDVEVAKLHTFALAMVGKTSLSGVQRKISLGFDAGRQTLRVAAGQAQFILKPQGDVYPHTAENELVTMVLAARCGIDTAPCALVRLRDGTIAYITQRFDRSDDGKRAMEDFCQLASLPPKDKYAGSAELCARIVHRYASEPIIEAAKLFRRMAFAWWTGNGDMHLKNFALLRGDDSRWRLAPAYDLLATRLLIADDRLALPLAGRDDRLTRNHLLDYAASCRVPKRAAGRILGDLADRHEDLLECIEASPLPGDLRAAYGELLDERVSSLTGDLRKR